MRSLLLVLPLLSTSCAIEVADPGPAPIRRLTSQEYDNTVFHLLGDNSRQGSRFAPDEEALGFDNQAAAQTVSPLLAEQLQLAAEIVAEQGLSQLLAMAPGCADHDAPTCDASAPDFVAQFGRRAFRRPLQDAEIDLYTTLFEAGTGLGEGSYDGGAGPRLVVETMLQSPFFLYRVEVGEPARAGTPTPLTSHELAARLSYALWGSMPDDELAAAADADALQDPEVFEYHARRLLSLPPARRAIGHFFGQWLSLDDIEPYVAAAGKDRDLYPDYRPSLLALLTKETSLFIEDVVFGGQQPVEALFTADYTMMNAELVEFYGLDPTGYDDRFVRVDLDPDVYSGFLTQAGLLSLHAKPDRSSPVHRGHWVREALLCQIPPPPPDVVPEPPEIDETGTTRDQFEQHVSDPSCAGCHQLMDPIGFGFESFDALGRYRATQGGQPIDASGELLGTVDINGAFDGVKELGQKLGTSQQVRDCITVQWFRFAHGRSERTEDVVHLETIGKDFADGGFQVLDLIVATTLTDAFRYRIAPEVP